MNTAQLTIKDLYNSAQSFFKTLELDLKDPVLQATYASGQKDSYLIDVFQSLTTQATNLILDVNGRLAVSPNDPTLDRQMQLLSAIYFELITTLLDLLKIRTSDIQTGSTIFNSLTTYRNQIKALAGVSHLEGLRKEIQARQVWFKDKPNVKDWVSKLAFQQTGNYLVGPAKPVGQLVNNEVIAEVAGFPIQGAAVSNLPAGVAINPLSGEIFVENHSALVSGKYQVEVRAADVKGGVSSVPVTLEIGENYPSEYIISPARAYRSYASGDVLAKTLDAEGIVSAVLNSGSLPPGTTLNSTNGTVSVSTPSALVPGSWAMNVLLTDSRGKVEEHTLRLALLDDKPATYKAETAKPIGEYKDGTVLATVTDPDGAIVAAQVTQMPAGLGLDTATGQIRVLDRNAVVPGDYQVAVALTGTNGEKSYQRVSLKILPNQANPATYTLISPKALAAYLKGDKLGFPNDTVGQVVGAYLLSGTLPPGVLLHKTTGVLTVGSPALLQPGMNALKIVTINNAKRETQHTVNLQIGLVPKYVVAPPRRLEAYAATDILAYPIVPAGSLTSATVVSGNLPAGTALNISTGEIHVVTPTSLQAGTFTVNIRLIDVAGGNNTIPVVLDLRTDLNASYQYATSTPISMWKKGDRVAWISDPDGQVVSATITTGGVPKGLAFNTQNGDVTVDNPTLLIPGKYTNTLVAVTDTAGGKSTLTLSLTLPTDVNLVYNVIQPTPYFAIPIGTVLANLVSTTGLYSAILESGPLPPGCSLNMSTGVISYTDSVSGGIPSKVYPITIETKTLAGTLKQHSFRINILATGESGPYYVVTDPKPYVSYFTDELLAYVVHPNAGLTIVSATLSTSSMLPPGVGINNQTGQIRVLSTSQLEEGEFDLLVILKDSEGNSYTVPVGLEFQGIDLDFVVTAPKALESYATGERLVTEDDPGDISDGAAFTWGVIPDGAFDDGKGQIIVDQPQSLMSGIYELEIRAEIDNSDPIYFLRTLFIGTSGNQVAYLTHPGIRYSDARLNMLFAKPYTPGLVCQNVYLTRGVVPPGMTMNSTTGEFRVTDLGLLTSGQWSIEATVIASGSSYNLSFLITIN